MNTITRTVATAAITAAALIGGTGLAAADVPPATTSSPSETTPAATDPSTSTAPPTEPTPAS